MHILKHALATGVMVAGSVWINGSIEPNNLMMLVAGGVLVDLDHVVYFLVKNKFSIKKAIDEHNKCYKESEPRLFLMHTFEAVVMVGLLAVGREEYRYFLIGFVLHLLLDIVLYLERKKGMVWVKMWSLGYQLAKSKSQK